MEIICIGRNYTEHIKELENEKPRDPVVFLKPDTSILLKKQPFFIPDFSKLFTAQIWIDAMVQVFYQTGVACSGIAHFASLNPKKEKFLIGIYIIPISLVICGMLCAINIFMYMGHFSKV